MAKFALLVFALLAFQTEAAPLQRRQIGGIQCNVARLQTVSGLSATTKAVNQLASASASDETVSSAIAQAQEGLSDAQGGIQTIAKALLTGQDAPADARTQVGDGLESAQSALQSIESNDPAITSGVQDALNQLAKTAKAGERVVSTCGGGGGGAAGAGGGANSGSPNPTSPEAFDKRQIGNIQCNVARFKTVKSLADTTNDVNAIAAAAGSDPATSSAAQTAQTALGSAQAGIGQIAGAIVTLQKAPAASRDQVLKGLTDAKTALTSISSTDPAVTSMLSKAQGNLDKTMAAGQDVLSSCK